jgi:hypothetical protein
MKASMGWVGMRKIATAMSAAAVVLSSAGLYAQARPNFSGKWLLDAEKTAAAAQGGGRLDSPITIAMDAVTFRITRPSKDGSGTATTYKLDGPERKTKVVRPGDPSGQTIEEVSKATIEGSKVVIKTTGTNGETASVWYLEGGWLVNERTGPAGVFKAFYRKG